MQIKRKLVKLANSLSPQIEAMNVGIELHKLADRAAELVAYAQEKIDRSASRKPLGQEVFDKRRAAQEEVVRQQALEAEENLRDQEEAARERELRHSKSKRPDEPEIVVSAEPEPEPEPEPIKKKVRRKKKKA